VGERASELRRGDPAGDAAPDATPETAALREDIEQTRAEMGGTIDAIQEKLDPEVLQEQAKDTIQEAKQAALEVMDHAVAQAKEAVGEAKEAVRGATIGKVEDMARYAGETAGGWRQTLMETIKAHPVPAAVAGLSLGYLFLNRESGRGRRPRYGGAMDDGYGGRDYAGRAYGGTGAYGGYQLADEDGRGRRSMTERAGAVADRAQETVGQIAGQAQERVGQAVDTVQDTAGQVTGQVQEAAGQVTGQVQEAAGQVVDQVQEQASRAQSFLGRQLEENPLAVGAVAVVLGGALGAALGTTPREDRLFGGARDAVVGRAQEVTHETLEKAGRVVGEVKDTAGRAAEEITSTAEREARAQDLLPERGGSGSASGEYRSGDQSGGGPGGGAA
jgi:uncharacterized protein YjbJ (UPF0337 family)